MIESLKLTSVDPRQLSPAALAFVGDGVFELLVRERLLDNGTLPAQKLHQMAVRRVRASAQAAAYETLWDECSVEERNILKRGRNAHGAHVPKSCTPEEYRKATGVEALFGYLYLKGETGRVNELYGVVNRVYRELEEQGAE